MRSDSCPFWGDGRSEWGGGSGSPVEQERPGVQPKAGGAGGKPGWDLQGQRSGAGQGSTRGDCPSSTAAVCGMDAVQGPGQGSAGLSTPLPTRGPCACSLGCFGCEQPRPLLESNVQLSHEPCGVVVTAMPAPGPACMKKHGFVCRKSHHLHSGVFTTAHGNRGGRCVCVCVGCMCTKLER